MEGMTHEKTLAEVRHLELMAQGVCVYRVGDVYAEQAPEETRDKWFVACPADHSDLVNLVEGLEPAERPSQAWDSLIEMIDAACGRKPGKEPCTLSLG